MDDLLPLFPLQVVLLPGAPLPLHIFEERYKGMIAECLHAQSQGHGQEEFGVLLAQDGKVHSVGCTAHIEEVTRRYDDGRLDIMAVGRRRFLVRSTDQTKPFLQGNVKFFDDDQQADPPSDVAVAQALDLFTSLVKSYDKSGELTDRFPLPEQFISFQIASVLPIDLSVKQSLLAERNEPARLSQLAKVMEALIARFELRERVRVKAGGNGHVQLR